jgi:pyruvate/2-oxoglutarate dehydrogenase complex dihydrolipoamide dehydrogenase (E3) component
MVETLNADICVIGAGSGGLSVAAGAAQMGARTVLLEKGEMGGDCLNYGCVPSKSLLAAGKAAEAMRQAGRYGVDGAVPQVDFRAVHDHVHGVIAAIAPHDSQARFEGMGVTVIRAAGRFTGPDQVIAGDTAIRARRFVVATGSTAMVPPIPGLDKVPYFTNETLFDNTELPERLVVIGGGPIGIEMAQAHRHLGARVTVVEMFGILAKDDPELVEIVRRRLLADGVELREHAKVLRVDNRVVGGSRTLSVVIERAGVEERIDGSHLLVATGRRAVVDGLDLEAAGIAYDATGIAVDRRLRTSNKRVFAIGDVAGGYQFTHMANYHAGIVLRNALFRLPARVDERAVPWVTFTSPELAHVGLGEEAARRRSGEIRVLRWSFEENDRAQAERDTEGMAKVITSRRGRVLGASIVGHNAGDLIQPWILVIAQKLKIGAMANHIVPYPTRSEINKRVAGSFYTPTLFSERTRRIVRLLAKLG